MPKHSTTPGRGGLLTTIAVALCVVGGTSLIGISLASQQRAAEVPATPIPSEVVIQVPAPDDTWLRSAAHASDVKGPILNSSAPVGLEIPAIGVRSVVQHLGQTSDGALETPAPGPHYNEAAWYRYSPTPGSLGPAILLGHIDSAAEGPSVFFRLGDLRRGDEVSVRRADGSVAVFVVDDVRRYAKDDFPTDLVYGDIDHAGLRILTCGGAFDEATGHYLDNIVVFASLTETSEEEL